jgi:hypothetical protein
VHILKLSDDVANGTSYGGVFFRLACDIELGGCAWKPIGYSRGPFDKREFCGVLDGCGYSISDFVVDAEGDVTAGLFGYTEHALIQNLGVRNCSVTGGDSVGCIVGFGDTSTLSGCYAEGKIATGASNAGSLIGLAANCLLLSCVSNVEIESKDGNVAGGLCGYVYNGTVIRDCESRGELKCSGLSDVGGLVGSIKDSAMENCRSGAVILSVDCGNVGGFGGVIRNCKLDACIASGRVSASNDDTNALVGGFVGFTNSVITRCVATGKVGKSGVMGAVGGFVGDIMRGTISASYSTGDVFGDGAVGGFAGSANCVDGAVTSIGNCYCLGAVSADNMSSVAGGFIGNMRRGGGNMVVEKCYSYGTISSRVRGFVGKKDANANILDCVWRREEEGVNENRSDVRGIPFFSTDEFGEEEKFIEMSWSFYDSDNIWFYHDSVSPRRPHLRGLSVIQKS